jgi:hypothetical protein
MRYLWAMTIIFLFLLSSCSEGTLRAKPIDDSELIDVEVNVKSDICSNVFCGETEECVSGECVCRDGFKKCGSSCIKDSGCCTSKDCMLGEACEAGACIRHVCGFNEIYDSGDKECTCIDGTKWCAWQKKCIPKTFCCIDPDCDTDYRCAETYFLSSVCVEDGTKKKCSSIAEGRSSRFYIKGVPYDIFVKEVSESFIMLKINDLELEPLPVKVPYEENGAKIYFESAQILGGICKEIE